MKNHINIRLGARSSQLSRKQVEEVVAALPDANYQTLFFETTGDKDLKTSLRNGSLGDFFTKELDEALLLNTIDAAIHSAKDVPPMLPEGLKLVALTKGVSALDALVTRKGETLATLKEGAVIATSSRRREELLAKKQSDITFVDIRGTVNSRIQKVLKGDIDGLVVAHAALLRLDIENIEVELLEGSTAKYQGRLAIVARKNDERIYNHFLPINTKKTLYFGVAPKPGMTHVPLIETTKKSLEADRDFISKATLFIFTSKTAVRYFVEEFPDVKQRAIAVGEKTAEELTKAGFSNVLVAKEETGEGVVTLLSKMSLNTEHVFYPHSSLSRDDISSYLQKEAPSYRDVVLYETTNVPPQVDIDIDDYDELYFSSPSTVDGFVKFYGKIPDNMFIKVEGPVTRQYIGDMYGRKI